MSNNGLQLLLRIDAGLELSHELTGETKPRSSSSGSESEYSNVPSVLVQGFHTASLAGIDRITSNYHSVWRSSLSVLATQAVMSSFGIPLFILPHTLRVALHTQNPDRRRRASWLTRQLWPTTLA